MKRSQHPDPKTPPSAPASDASTHASDLAGSRRPPPGKKKPRRLDLELVERGLAASRDRAQRLIRAGKVLVRERTIDKPGTQVRPSDPIRLLVPDHPYVSRGGLKLDGALKSFAVDVRGLVAADLGASTGGFTHRLLLGGALRVYCVDVGYGILDYRLRTDPRVVVHERTNARHLIREDLGEVVDLVVGDLSFISLRLILPAVGRILRPGGRAVLLVKPQFELQPGKVGKGGIVRDPRLRQAAVSTVEQEARTAGFRVLGRVDSLITGSKGNQETFLYLERIGSCCTPVETMVRPPR